MFLEVKKKRNSETNYRFQESILSIRKKHLKCWTIIGNTKFVRKDDVLMYEDNDKHTF